MSFTRLSLSKINGNEDDKLLIAKGNIPNKDTILRNLQTLLPESSDLWQINLKTGRKRIVIGPENTGLIGGRTNKIIPSVSWETSEWDTIREFVQDRLSELQSQKIVPKDIIPTVLINYYPNGSSGISYHRDSTDNCMNTIISYSFGPEELRRKFMLRNVETGNEGFVTLGHGDSLIMTGSFNTNFQHAVETLKKSNENWGYFRYNLTIRFITPINPKIKNKKLVNWTKDDNGVLSFKETVDSKHPLKNIKFIPTMQVNNYLKKYMFRFKNWGNVGDYISDKKVIKELANKKLKKNVADLPDYYIYVSTKKTFKYLDNILSQLKNYLLWKMPRGNRFKDRKINLPEVIDIIFNFYDNEGNSNYTIDSRYEEGFTELTETITQKPKSKKSKSKKIIDKRYGFNVSECKRIEPQDIGKKGIVWAKNCKIQIDGQEVSIPGLNLQYPYAGWLVDGKKSIETRTWNLNQNMLDKYIAVIQTPGKIGKKNGVTKAEIIGYVKFSDTFEYNTNESWDNDQSKHLCDFKLDGTKC